MNKHQLALSGSTLSVTLALMACGAGNDGMIGNRSLGATTTTTQGVITGFGSVFVNGIEYFIGNNTSISMDGADKSESDLQVGMLVTVQGTVNVDGKIGMAKVIQYADLMEGVVTANTIGGDGTGTMKVMGQTVAVTADTVFDSKVAGVTSPDLIQIGNIIEVSGYSSKSGDVTATRIELMAKSQAAGAVIELKGAISNLDATNSTFTIGGLTVDYSGLTAANLPSPALANGLYVEVASKTLFNGDGPLIASKIDLEDDGFKGHEGREGEGLDVRGLVTADIANSRFALNGRAVLIDPKTQIVNGVTAQLTAGTQVKVEAHFDGIGNLVADRIEFKHEADLELEGALQAVNADEGTINILGKVIHVDSNTIMLDKSDDAIRYFNLIDLTSSNAEYLEVHAYRDATTGNLIATKVERENYSAGAEVRGTVDAVGDLVVAGVAIDISNADLLPHLGIGQIVKAKGIYKNDVLLAKQISLSHASADDVSKASWKKDS